MAVYVNTNYSALQGQRYLGNVQNQLTTTYQRLSSGMRINSAKDDAAGLQIADRLTSQINGLNQGNRNASDGIALAQTMEAGMDEISGMLQKIRTLAVQAANGTNTADDRKALGKEMGALATEINRISTQTTFAGKTVLNGQVKGSIFGDPAAGGPGAGGGNGPTVGKTGTMTLQVEFCERALRDWPVVLSRRPAYLRNLVCSQFQYIYLAETKIHSHYKYLLRRSRVKMRLQPKRLQTP